MSEATAGTISVLCACGKKLKAPASALGRKAKCPKCGNVLTITAPPPEPAEADPFDAMYDLAEQSAQAAAEQPAAVQCPGCRQPMAPGAVLCTNCGYDTRTGKSVAPRPASGGGGTRYDPTKAAAAQAAAKTKKSKAPDAMAPEDSFIKGLAASVVAAMAGGLVWFLIAWGTGYEIYFVVMMVGVLAGVGMQWGQKGYSYLGGAVAAAVTFVTMVIVRFAVVVALLVPMMRTTAARHSAAQAAMKMPDLSMYDPRVVESMFMNEIKNAPAVAAPAPAAKSKDEEDDEEEGDAPSVGELKEISAYQAVEKKLKAMPKPQYDAMIAKFDRDERDALLEDQLTRQVMGELHVSYRDGSVMMKQCEDEAKKRLAKMTEPEKEAKFAQIKAEQAREREKLQAELKAKAQQRKDSGEGTGAGAAVAITGIVIFFLVFGGIKGAIFTILAMAMAYRTASGSVSGS